MVHVSCCGGVLCCGGAWATGARMRSFNLHVSSCIQNMYACLHVSHTFSTRLSTRRVSFATDPSLSANVPSQNRDFWLHRRSLALCQTLTSGTFIQGKTLGRIFACGITFAINTTFRCSKSLGENSKPTSKRVSRKGMRTEYQI